MQVRGGGRCGVEGELSCLKHDSYCLIRQPWIREAILDASVKLGHVLLFLCKVYVLFQSFFARSIAKLWRTKTDLP
jgi:hypothetical protein